MSYDRRGVLERFKDSEVSQGLLLTMKFVSHSKLILLHVYRLGTLQDDFFENWIQENACLFPKSVEGFLAHKNPLL